jgi:beta-ureidopropionase / N-carbamoyl-L-amino-acid hydrolase
VVPIVPAARGIQIDPERFLADLRQLAQFGALNPGVDRPAFSREDVRAREWLALRMDEAGLEARIDGVGNVYGRARLASQTILIGSHSDTVPNGGWLDGAYGVVAALEIARACAQLATPDGVGVDIISFSDEEGRFLPTLGSSAFCGELTSDDWGEVRSADGLSLAEALNRSGYAGRPLATLDKGRHLAFLEAHIEQGPRLEALSTSIGVVTGIAGVRRRVVSFTGQSDHAGTTPIELRRDAGGAMIRYAADATELLRTRSGPSTVWNIGRLFVEPGASNVVPGRAEMLLEFRDVDDAVMVRLEAALDRLAERVADETRVEIESRTAASRGGARMDERLALAVESVAQDLNVSSLKMVSGAGHDARVVGRYVPAGMLFVPSIGGRSHNVEEDTKDHDLVTGARVLAAVTSRLLTGDVLT